MMRIIIALLMLGAGCSATPPYFEGPTYPVIAEQGDVPDSTIIINSDQLTYQAQFRGRRVYLFRGDTPVPLEYPREPYTLGQTTSGEPEGSTLGLHLAQFSQDARYLTAFGMTRDSDHAVYGIRAIVLVWETAAGNLLFAFHPQIDWVETIEYDLAGGRLLLHGCAAYGGLTYLYPRSCDGREPSTEIYSLQTGKVVSSS